MNEYRCKTCNGLIPDARAELGYTDTCVHHSEEVPHFGLMDYSHKTAGEVVIHRGGNEESIRRMNRIYRRSR